MTEQSARAADAPTIVVVGGYGAVGKEIAARLAPRFPGRVRVAGRRLDAALACAEVIGHGAQGVRLDSGREEWAFARGDVAVMCVEQEEPTLARQAIGAGAHYVDVSADLATLERLGGLDALARDRGAAGVLCVGLAPGLTNVLAARAAGRFDRLDRLDLIVILGAGDGHGRSAIEWTLDNLDSRFDATRAGLPRPVRAFEHRLPFRLGAETRRLPAFRFAFPEQRTLAHTLAAPTINSWLALEPAIAGYATALSSRGGTAALLRHPRARRLALAGLAATGTGAARCAAIVQAHGWRGGAPLALQLSASGHGQNATTAKVAAQVVGRMIAAPATPGMHHLEQLEGADELLAALAAEGVTLGEREIDGPA